MGFGEGDFIMSFIGLVNKQIVTVTIISAAVVLLQSEMFGQDFPQQHSNFDRFHQGGIFDNPQLVGCK